MELYPYQLDGLNQIRSEYADGVKKVLLHMATGGGKTVIFCEVLKNAASKGKRCLMVVKGRKLVDQASIRLTRENVSHGVFMANHSHFRPHENIQVCSIDTLRARDKIFENIDLIVIDEAHLAGSSSYINFLKSHQDAYILGVTATPYQRFPLCHIADKIIKPISIQDLITQGYLVPPRYFAPSTPDLSGVTIDSKTKDYNQKLLSSAMEKSVIVGNMAGHWKNLSENRPSLCFAVSVAHSKIIKEEFLRAGIPAEHCDADSSDQQRNEAIEKLKNGEIKVLTNCGLFSIGVDLPFVSCLILARPTKSYCLYVQQMGRGTRTCPEIGKKDFIVLDHAGNILRHGFIENEKEGNLDGKFKDKAPNIHQCPNCYAVIASFPCVECDYKKVDEGSKPRTIVIDQKATLSEIKADQIKFKPFTHEKIIQEIDRLNSIAFEKGFKQGWIWHVIKGKYGEDAAKKYLSHRFKR